MVPGLSRPFETSGGSRGLVEHDKCSRALLSPRGIGRQPARLRKKAIDDRSSDRRRPTQVVRKAQPGDLPVRLDGGYWVLLATHGGEDVVRSEPFEMGEIELKRLWGR